MGEGLGTIDMINSSIMFPFITPVCHGIKNGCQVVAFISQFVMDQDRCGGSDTAVVIESTMADDFWSYPGSMREHKLTARRIKEIICMPR